MRQYRIVSNGTQYFIQYRYRWFPFKWSFKRITDGYGYTFPMVFPSMHDAQDYLIDICPTEVISEVWRQL